MLNRRQNWSDFFLREHFFTSNQAEKAEEVQRIEDDEDDEPIIPQASEPPTTRKLESEQNFLHETAVNPKSPAAISDIPENIDDSHVDDLIEKIAESDQLIANPVASHHQIAADHISPSLYEDSDKEENLDEVEYHEPEENKMSW